MKRIALLPLLLIGIAPTLKTWSTVSISPIGGGSDDSSAIRAAISSAGAGGTVNFQAGTYSVHATQTGGACTSVAQINAAVTLKPTGAVKFVGLDGSGSSKGCVFSVNTSNVSIANGEFEDTVAHESSFITYGQDPRNPSGLGTGTWESQFLEGVGMHGIISNVTISGWYIHTLYQSSSFGFHIDNTITNLHLHHNWIQDVCGGGCSNMTRALVYGTAYPGSANCTWTSTSGHGECQWNGSGIEEFGGLNQTTISNNWIDWVGNDGTHFRWDGAINQGVNAQNVVYYHNITSRVMRMANEHQSCASGNCTFNGSPKFYPGDGPYVFQSNLDTAGCLATTTHWIGSINNLFANQKIINNTQTFGLTGTPSCDWVEFYYSPGFEVAMGANSFFQGNVQTGDEQGNMHQNSFGTQGSETSQLNVTPMKYNILTGRNATTSNFNKTLCGNFAGWWNQENSFCPSYPKLAFTGNWIAQTPPFSGNSQTSNIAGSFDSSTVQTFPSGSTASGTWNFGVVSNFSVDRVSFYVDNSTTPVVVQQLQDDTSTFASGTSNGISTTGDRRWKYHATFSVGPYADGTHTVRARVIDVGGARKDYTQAFTKGAGGTIQPPAAPTGLAASSNSSSSIVVNWANSGTGITYNLYRASASGFSIGASNRILTGSSALTFTDTGLLAGTTYYYLLTAVNSAGESGTSAEVPATTQGVTPPPPPFDAGLLKFLTNGTTSGNADFESGSLSPWITFTTGTFSSTGIDSGASTLTAASFTQMTSGMTPVKTYIFGTAAGSTITNMTDLAAEFDPYGIAAKTVINNEWERYQDFTAGANKNFVFTANTLDLVATINQTGGGLFAGGINSGQIWTKAAYTPGATGFNVYAQETIMQVPHGKGAWPASWWYMRNQAPFTPTDNSEIDNPEFFEYTANGSGPWTGFNHGPGAGANFYQIPSPAMTDSSTWPDGDLSADFHSFAEYWTTNAVYKYVDGVLIKASNFTWGAPFPAQHGVNLAVGSDLAGLASAGLQPNSTAEFPMKLSIKSQKIWGANSIATPSTAYAGNGSAKVCIGTVGTNTQIYLQPFTIPGGKQLTISYAMKDTNGSSFGTNLIQDVAPFTSYGWANYQQPGSTNWKQYSLTTQGPANTVTDARLSFILTGLQAGECFELDNVSIVAATPLPAAPTGLSATTASASAINLTWTASATSGVTYNVYQNGSKMASGLAGTSYSATGLSANTTYTFAVSSTNAMGESPQSTLATATTGALPTDPTGISATAKSTTEIDLAYTRCAGCTASIYRGSTAGFAVSAANRIASGVAADAYQDLSLTTNTTYFYAVTDSNQFGESGGLSRASAKTLAVTTPPGFDSGYVNNGDFSGGTTGWTLTQGTGAATFTIDNTGACQVPAAKVTVTTAGTITLSQTVKPIVANQQATLALFTLGASNIPVSFGSTLGGSDYGLAASPIASTSTCKSQSINWFTPNSAISNGILTIDLSGFAAGTSVYLAQIAMTSVNGPPIDSTPLTVTPSTASLKIGQSVTFTLNRAGTGSIPSPAVGTAANVDSLHVSYTAPSSIPMQHTIAGCPVAPNDSVFNTRIDSLGVHSSSATWLAQIPGGAVLKIDPSLPHNVIDNTVPGSNQTFAYTTAYNGQTFQIGGDKRENGLYTLNGTTDHHRISLNRQTCQIYETYQDGITRTDVPGATAASGWQYAGTGYSLPSTSSGGGATDAAGLPLLPLLATASELQSGAIRHALRFTLSNGYTSNGAAAWPASTSLTSANGTGARAGARFRLKSSFTLSGGVCNAYCQTILTTLKQYGMLLADLGTSGLIQVDADTTADPLAITAFGQIATASIPFTQFDIVDESSLMQVATSSQVPLASATGTVGALTVTPSGVAAVTVPISLQGVGIQPTPRRLIVRANDPAVQLAGTVNGTTDQVLTWALTSGPGSVTSGGLYTPPSSTASAASAVVTATADADGTVTAPVLITVMPAGNIYIDSGASSTATDSNGHTWQFQPLPEASDLTITTDTTDPLGIWSSVTDAFLAQTQIKTYGGDIVYGTFALPNGNYQLTLQFAQVGSTGTGCQATYSPLTYPAGTGAGPMNIEVNGQTEAYGWDLGKATGYLCRTPATVTVPVQVSDGSLQFAVRSTSTPSLTDQWNPYINSVSIVPDAGAAHWTIDTQQTTTLQPGDALQLNVVSWYAGAAVPIWSIVSGPGAISASGLYTAPVSLLQTSPVLIRATDGTYTATVRLYVIGLDYPVLLTR